MSFLDSIGQLQQSSPRKKLTVLVLTVAVAMGAVIWLWVLQLRYTIFAHNTDTTPADNNHLSLFEPLKLVFGTAYRNALDGVKSIYEK